VLAGRSPSALLALGALVSELAVRPSEPRAGLTPPDLLEITGEIAEGAGEVGANCPDDGNRRNRD
jgi:hypothetical protein